ncbi:unnamed protein product [Mytilus edulis]|uniref:Uncharacterized protein n=1 Tax=Mytilus edulis TaxID=6550 RepID=A0A8S3S8N2_MYTED|nr:unnamed protein product [Mytilus edulis]
MWQIFLYDEEFDSISYRSSTVTEFHRKVLSKGEYLEEIQKNHKTDHRKRDTVFETRRKSFFPVVRENFRLLFKLNIKLKEQEGQFQQPILTQKPRDLQKVTEQHELNGEVNGEVKKKNTQDTAPVERSSNIYNATPLADITNSQMVRNTDMMQTEVSPYYREIYAKRLLANAMQTNSNKRIYSDSNIYTDRKQRNMDRDLYRIELFPRKSQVIEMQTFNPNINDTIDFRPNSALSAGTNVFLSGYWRKGIVMDIQMDDYKGRVYTEKDLENHKIHCLSKYLIRPNFLY